MADPAYLITGSQAAAILGISRQAWYQKRDPTKPEPAQHYPCDLWRETDVRAYAEARRARIAEREAQSRGAGDVG